MVGDQLEQALLIELVMSDLTGPQGRGFPGRRHGGDALFHQIVFFRHRFQLDHGQVAARRSHPCSSRT
jgi:hypothetical protein